jgi:glycosyltransferase involved in cell wall biosynthesis
MDWHKNLNGAIAAFAKLPGDVRSRHQLVIVCPLSEEFTTNHKRQAKLLGLADNDVVVTGFIPDADLRALYTGCSAFMFPSLYEGLGLPVLEAMACGAPVIGGNHSSIREIIVRQDALFDVRSSDDMAKVLHHVLTNKVFADDLRRHGLSRAKEFTFERTGRLALEAFDEAIRRKRHAGVSCAMEGWQPRKRLALLTPLPPAKSGIANYSAELLPFLARHFDIDVYIDGQAVSDNYCRSAFRIYHYSDFEAVASTYDLILYQFGNSPFHAHMFDLLERFPGVVTMHDAFLSSVLKYMDHEMNQPGLFLREMLYSHGPRARRRLNAGPDQEKNENDAKLALPCTKRVLDQALGIIAHSPFHLTLAREHYPEGFQAPFRILNMPLALPPEIDEQEREAIRRKLFIPESALVIASFGHMRGNLLVQALADKTLAADKHLYLVFVGQPATIDLKQAIKQSEMRERIRITDFVNDDEYRQWLVAANMAVQLCENFQSETSGTTLDCLANGVPLILNDYASSADYPDDIVRKIGHPIHVTELAAAIGELAKDSKRRRQLGAAGREYVRKHHNPAQCAAQYAATLRDFYGQCQLERTDSLAKAFGPHLKTHDNQPVGAMVAKCLSKFCKPQFSRRRLYIDVTYISKKDPGTGIQRVVREITRQLYRTDLSGIEPNAIRFEEGRFVSASQWLSTRNITAQNEHPCHGVEKDGEIFFQPGDILLMLDSSWEDYAEMAPHFQAARHNETTIVFIQYDILPILMPEVFTPGFSPVFEKYLLTAAKEGDALLSISRATANAARQWLGENHPELLKNTAFLYWHLGSDFNVGNKDFPGTQRTECLKNVAYLLMAGTVEPRKNQALAIEAMERLWQSGVNLSLCVAGKKGWLVDKIIKQLRNNIDPRLVFMEGPSDEELSWLYNHAKGLLFVSKDEGFGLPLVEAANYGTPIICSDIPVFHEIAGDFATYVRIDNAAHLAEDIKAWWKRAKQGSIPDSSQMPRLTWEESARRLLELLLTFRRQA